ncbi:Atrophin-1 multi-domain protein [Oxalobacteraceae bacterium OTU3REALA1]|nr:Atrophin-1 multi-domain protein [Oxalobacteraceae bacterium OTU3REALA1]
MKKYLVLALASTFAAGAFAQTAPFGTFTKPFAADSPWNIRPINPVLGGEAPPLSPLQPGSTVPWSGQIAQGIYSTAAFLANKEDSPMVVYPVAGSQGVWDPDAREYLPSITVPRWPSTVTPASGGDGHADIVDPESGKVYSFWQLKFIDGKWRATQTSWSALGGKGWGDPSHIYQGARAVGVPTIGGVIRKHEVNDGETLYKHVLAMSMSREALQGKPASYVYPATSADNNSATLHTGKIPEGALIMLPQSYQPLVNNPLLKKVVETLKVYGARVVDENTATPFYIYVENGAAFSLLNGTSADTQMYAELERLRKELRQVVTADSYVDGNGAPTTTNVPGNDNILSMRGPWVTYPLGGTTAPFNSLTQSIEFPSRPAVVEQQNGNGTGISGGPVNNGGVTWARPVAGATYQVKAIGTGGAQMRVQLSWYPSGQSTISNVITPWLADGQTASITWPTGAWATVWARNGVSQKGSIRATMIKQ